MAGSLAPGIESVVGGSNGGIDILAIGGGNAGKGCAGGRIDAFKVLTTGGLKPLIVDKEAKGLMIFEPGLSGGGGLGSWTVVHAFKYVHYFHGEWPPKPGDYDG